MSAAEDAAKLRLNIQRLDAFMNGAAGDTVALDGTTITSLLGLIGSTVGPAPPPVTWPGRHWYDTSVDPAVLQLRNETDTAWTVATVSVVNALSDEVAALTALVNQLDNDYAQLGGATFTGQLNIERVSPIFSLIDGPIHTRLLLVAGVARVQIPDNTYLLIEGQDGAGKVAGIRLEMASGDETVLHTGNAPYGRRFESAGQTVVQGAITSVAHGLGTAPVDVDARAICTVANGGFLPGDVVFLRGGFGLGGSSPTLHRGFQMRADATNVSIWLGDDGLVVLDPATFQQLQLTLSSWAFHLRAYA